MYRTCQSFIPSRINNGVQRVTYKFPHAISHPFKTDSRRQKRAEANSDLAL